MGANKIIMNTPNGENVLIDLTGDSVTPSDLAEGVTTHGADGEPIVGTIPTPPGLNMEGYAGIEGFYPDHKELVLEKYVESDVLLRKGAWIGMRCNTNEFGDASPADVAKGKTFTSVNGLKVVGTAEGGGASLPNAETKEFGMQTVDVGWSWFKMGFQGKDGYYEMPSFTPEMTDGHPYLIYISYESGDSWTDEIIATDKPLFFDSASDSLLSEPCKYFVYDANYEAYTWEQVDQVENETGLYGGVPPDILYWSNYDIYMSAADGGEHSGWIGYEPIPIEIIENGEFTTVESKYEISGEMLNRLAASLQDKTAYQEMLTPEMMIDRISKTGMFCFNSRATGELL